MSAVELREERGVTVAELEGEIDHSNGSAVGRRLEKALVGTGDGLVVDLSRVDFIDSSAISALFGLARVAREQERSLALVIPQGSVVERVLRVVAIDEVVPVAHDLESAVSSVLQAR